MNKRKPEIQASEYAAPPEMIRIARERTRDILGAWQQQIRWGPVDFMILVESAYMQGINDSIDALQQRGLEIVPVTPQEVWEGYCG